MRILLFRILGTVLVLFIGAVLWRNGVDSETPQAEDARDPAGATVASPALAPEVEDILTGHIARLAELLREAVIVTAVADANEQQKTVGTASYGRDERWLTADNADPYITSLLENEVARRLMEFQEENPGFSEIFVTDADGFNVGQTNRTTDYYQADEDWWIGGYNGGAGMAYHGAIEFDESASAEAISLYVPVIDPASGRAIGVAKAVLSLALLKLAL